MYDVYIYICDIYIYMMTVYIYIPNIYQTYISSTRTRRAGSCLRVILQYLFHLYNLHAPCASQARACVLCATSKNMTCGPPRCNATPNKHFLHTSHCTLHTPHFTLRTPHFISSHLSSSHLLSPHLSSSHLISSPMSSK